MSGLVYAVAKVKQTKDKLTSLPIASASSQSMRDGFRKA